MEENRTSFTLLVMGMLFTTCLVTGFLLPVKAMQLGPFTLPGGSFAFPLTYGITGVVTEVWGYKVARLMIWYGLCCVFLFGTFAILTQLAPAASFYHDQESFDTIFGKLPRIIFSLAGGYLIGEFSSAIMLSHLKVFMGGRLSFVRLYFAPLTSQILALSFFLVVEFGWSITHEELAALIFWRLWLAVIYHSCIVGFMTQGASWLKKREGIDMYDIGISRNPFRW